MLRLAFTVSKYGRFLRHRVVLSSGDGLVKPAGVRSSGRWNRVNFVLQSNVTSAGTPMQVSAERKLMKTMPLTLTFTGWLH